MKFYVITRLVVAALILLALVGLTSATVFAQTVQTAAKIKMFCGHLTGKDFQKCARNVTISDGGRV